MTTLLTTAEAATRLNVSRRAVQVWVASGELVHIRRGRYLRIDERDLEEFIRRHKTGGNVLAFKRGA